MECPYIKILSPELEFLYEIDRYTSLDFRRSWQGVGDFTLVPDGFYPCFKKNNIIMVGDDPHKAGVIRTVNVSETDKVITTVTGQTLDGFTFQRTVLPLDNNGGYFSVPPQSQHRNVSAEEIIKTFISSCLGADAEDTNRRLMDGNGRIMLVTGQNRHRGYPTEWGCRYTALDEELQAICEYCDCGYEIYIDFENSQYVAEYISGTDRSVNNSDGRSCVILSTEFESVSEIVYTDDYSSYKNIAYCGGKGEGDDRAVISVTNEADTPAGIDRFETFIDCGELEIAETPTALSLGEEGKHKLEEHNFIKSLTAKISAAGSFVYGRDFELGDLVTVQSEEIGLEQDIRISEVVESFEPQNYSVSVTLGKPPKRIKRAIRSIRNEVR